MGRRLVVTLVHGTFGRSAKWIKDGGRLREALSEAGALPVAFIWSGRNGHRARIKAAAQLASFLGKQLADDPHVIQCVVAHSHGGNVAVHAVHNEMEESGPRAQREPYIVTLSTPFIHMRERQLPLVFLATWPTATLVAIPLLGMLWTMGGDVNRLLVWSSTLVGAFNLAQLLLVRIVLGAKWLQELVVLDAKPLDVSESLKTTPSYPDYEEASTWRANWVRRIHAPEVRRGRLLAIRAPGDEATGVLAGDQFAAWIGMKMGGPLISWWLFAVPICLSLVFAYFFFFGPFNLEGVSHLLVVLAGLLAFPALVVCHALGATVLASSLVFGVDGPALSFLGQASAEATPPGDTRLLQLQPFPETMRGLAHSHLYDNDYVIRLIVDEVLKVAKDLEEDLE